MRTPPRATPGIQLCRAPGTWKITATVTDHAGNTRTYQPWQLAALGIRSTIRVKAHDVTPPKAVVPAKVDHSESLVVNFSEATLWAGSAPPFAVYQKSNHASVPGKWTCRNAKAALVGCQADGADVAVAFFAPTNPWSAGKKYVLHSSSGLYDASGNGPSHVTATFTAV